MSAAWPEWDYPEPLKRKPMSDQPLSERLERRLRQTVSGQLVLFVSEAEVDEIATLEAERDEYEKKLMFASDDLAFLDKVRRENERLTARVDGLERELHDCRSLQEHVEGENERLRAVVLNVAHDLEVGSTSRADAIRRLRALTPEGEK